MAGPELTLLDNFPPVTGMVGVLAWLSEWGSERGAFKRASKTQAGGATTNQTAKAVQSRGGGREPFLGDLTQADDCFLTFSWKEALSHPAGETASQRPGGSRSGSSPAGPRRDFVSLCPTLRYDVLIVTLVLCPQH